MDPIKAHQREVRLEQHELLSKFTVDQYLELIWDLECDEKLMFVDGDERERFIQETLGHFQHDLRVAVLHER